MAEEKQSVMSKDDVVLFSEIVGDGRFRVKQIANADKKAEYDHDLANETKKCLNSELEFKSGAKGTPAKVIAQAMIAYVMENPTPINVKTLGDVIGDNVVKVDVGGMGIEKFLETVAPDEGK